MRLEWNDAENLADQALRNVSTHCDRLAGPLRRAGRAIGDRRARGQTVNFALLDTVVLEKDLPEYGLCRGDLGAPMVWKSNSFGFLGKRSTRGAFYHAVRTREERLLLRPRCHSGALARPMTPDLQTSETLVD